MEDGISSLLFLVFGVILLGLAFFGIKKGVLPAGRCNADRYANPVGFYGYLIFYIVMGLWCLLRAVLLSISYISSG